MNLLKHTLKYQVDSTKLFERLSHKPWAILLDSGQPQSQYGRYDIIVADPFIMVSTIESGAGESSAGVRTEITQSGQVNVSTENPFDVLNKLMAPYQAVQTALPFSGGALGYFAYDLARQVEILPNLSLSNESIPHMMVGIYDWAVIVDHREKTACLVSHGFQQSTHEHWADLCALFDEPAEPQNIGGFELTSAVSSNMDFS